MLALYTGLQIGEICALSWDNVDFNNMAINVSATVSSIKKNNKAFCVLDLPKTKSSVRSIPIPGKLFYALSVLADKNPTGFVRSSKTDFVIPRTFELRFHRILNALNIEYVIPTH